MLRRPSPAALKLGALHAASFAGFGVHLPFFPVWLEARGLQPVTIGLILAVPILVRILVTAPILGLVDRGLPARTLLILAQGGAVFAYAALGVVEGPLAIGLVAACLAFAQASVVPTVDLVTNDAARRDPSVDYGRARLWGSLAFLAASLGAGSVLLRLPADAVTWILAALSLQGVAAALLLPREVGLQARRDGAEPGRRSPFPASLSLVIAATACVQASHAALYGFSSLAWQAQGHGTATIGLFWAIAILAEVALFALAGRHLTRAARAIALVALGGAAGLVRFSAMALEPGFGATAALQLLHALTFGGTQLGAMLALSHLAPPGGRGRAQGVLAASVALAMAAGTVASGPLYRAGEALVYLGMLPFSAAGLALALLALRAERPAPATS